MVFISRGPSKKSGELGNHETWYAVKFKSIKILILNKKETRNFAFPDISSLQRTSPSLIVIKRFLLSYCTICWYFYYVQCFLLKKKSPHLKRISHFCRNWIRQFLKFRSAFFFSFGFFWEYKSFMGSFEEKLTRKIPTTLFYACL